MSAAGWAQLVALIVGDRHHRTVARPIHRERLLGYALATRSDLRTDRTTHLPRLPGRPGTRAALERLRTLGPRVQRRGRLPALRHPTPPERSSVQPHRHVERRPGAVVQHRRQLHDQHELAELRRREHDEPLHADGRAHRAALRVGGGRDGRHGRAHPRALARRATHDRQLLGRPHPDVAAHPAAVAFVFAILLAATGVIQNTNGFTQVHTVAGATQQIPGGPEASQESIKQLGTNGGGFFNTNSAHPFANPTKISDFFELYAILIIPFSLAFTFGRMVKDKRQGYAVFAVMGVSGSARTAIAIPVIESRATRISTPGASPRRSVPRPAGTWKARRFASGHRHRASGAARPPGRPTARSTRCTTATRRSAACSS